MDEDHVTLQSLGFISVDEHKFATEKAYNKGFLVGYEAGLETKQSHPVETIKLILWSYAAGVATCIFIMFIRG